MLQSLSNVERIAASTRRDFERGAVTDGEIIKAAIALDAAYGISTYAPHGEEGEKAKIEAGELIRVDRHLFRVPLVANRRFPEGCCDVASRVLGYRLLEAKALEGRMPEIISGGCEEDTDTFDPTSYYHNPHTFVGIGGTALGRRTIADITADQFGTGLPPVYVGPLEDPWTDDPNLEANNW